MAKLKVFRTPIGFQDAYVAAPSQKAALLAWGTDADLFARGVAERVEDPALTAEPLRRPGEVIRLSRGTAAEHLKALGKRPKPSRRPQPEPDAAKPDPPRPRRSRPRPSRAALERAEQALADAEREQAERLAEIKARRQDLEQEERALRADFEARARRLEAARDKARERFAEKLEAWAATEAEG